MPIPAHPRQNSAGAAAGLHSTGTARHAHFAAARQASVDVTGDNGCCLVKALISNLLTFATRSRRKGAELATGGGREPSQRAGPCNNGNGVCPLPEATALSNPSACTSSQKKTGVISFSQTGSAKSARKTVQSVDTCIAESIDDQMVDKICALPKGLEKSEWLATHVLALFEHVSGFSETLSEVCTPVTCSIMSFPGNMKASWVDERGKRHNYSAMRYIDSVLSFCEASRKNQQLFPTKYGATFCADFDAHCARMVRLLWHSCGHMYSKHWDHLGSLNLRPQFGLVLAHLAKLAKLYGLLQDGKEQASMLNTLQLVRPPVGTNEGPQTQQPLQRPTKRAQDDSTGSNANPNTVQGRIQQQQKKEKAAKHTKQDKKNSSNNHQKQQNSSSGSVIAMKSGSWGGHSAATVMAASTVAGQPPPTSTNNNNDLLANCQKCYAQTC